MLLAFGLGQVSSPLVRVIVVQLRLGLRKWAVEG